MDIICGNGRHFNDSEVAKACAESKGGCDRCKPFENTIKVLPRDNQEIQIIWPKDMPPASWHK